MIHMSKKCILAALLAALLLSACTALADTATVTADSLYMREGPDSATAVVKVLRNGNKLEVLGKKGNWYQVSFGKYSGYVYKDYVVITEDGDDDVLQKGDKGAEVKQLQQRLKELGYYSSSCDGNFGTVTVNAVKAFQKKNGLSQSGMADEATLKKLNSTSAIKANGTASAETTGTLQKGHRGQLVKQLQQRLKELGYYTSTIDSSYGNQTVNAVKAFQKKNGLSQTGVADAATQKKLYSSSAVKANAATTTTQDETLRKGDKGTAVKQLQQRLKELGYYKSAIDSDFGTQTVNAVKAFQKKNGLSQTGVVDSATLKKLNSSSAVKANETVTTTQAESLKKGDKGAAVKQLQQRLKELGYYTAYIDSQYGTKTVNAVKAFQKKNGLTADGVAGAATIKKLNSTSAVRADAVTEDKNETTTGLKRGDKGTEVKRLQTRLKELGYYTAYIDSEYGTKTVNAVKAFQKKNGLTQTGIADTVTLQKLNSTSAVKANGSTNDTVATDSTLKSGSKGEAVKALQTRLKALGYYNSAIDGDYGYKTIAAVKAFQKKNGLTADGVAGTTTLKKVNSSTAVKANATTTTTTTTGLKSGDKGAEVKKLQERLKELGYYTSVIDSEYGAKTVAAVKAFQQKNGLTADGVAGTATLKKINSTSAIKANNSTTNNTNTSTTLNTNQTLKSGDSGAQVRALQTRLKALGYYTPSVDGDYGYRTVEAVSAFQRANKLTVNGIANPATLRKLVSSSAVAAGTNTTTTGKYKTEKLDWFKNGESVFSGRPVIEIKDVRTGLVFKGKVLYGSHHLDVEPLTKADTATLLKINGGVEFKWYRRPMLVKHNGHVYAASIYSVPHGEQTILNNNFEGQFCLHFYGSKTHGTDEVKQDHQEAIAEAMKATW